MEPIKPYKKDAGYSYTLGAFPTIELLNCRPSAVREVFVYSSFTDRTYIPVLFEVADAFIYFVKSHFRMLEAVAESKKRFEQTQADDQG